MNETSSLLVSPKSLNSNRKDTTYLLFPDILRENYFKFYIYQFKRECPFKIVIGNLHTSTNVEEIKMTLKDIGDDARGVANIRHCTRELLLLLFVDPKPKITIETFMDTKLLSTELAE